MTIMANILNLIRTRRAAAPTDNWLLQIKRTVARFARGNISAQNGRIQLEEERMREHSLALRIAAQMRSRYRSGHR
jgi:hypothetical protein